MKDYSYFKNKIKNDPVNKSHTENGLDPLFSFSKKSKIIIIGQAPGAKTHISGKPWADASGKKLREWLGVSEEDFYNPDNFAFLPMDFYFPGKGRGGDLAPRKEFAEKWHQEILHEIKVPKLILLVGSYAKEFYLKDKKTLTERVKSYKDYLPDFFPLLHPSSRNAIWQKKNPFFREKYCQL